VSRASRSSAGDSVTACPRGADAGSSAPRETAVDSPPREPSQPLPAGHAPARSRLTRERRVHTGAWLSFSAIPMDRSRPVGYVDCGVSLERETTRVKCPSRDRTALVARSRRSTRLHRRSSTKARRSRRSPGGLNERPAACTESRRVRVRTCPYSSPICSQSGSPRSGSRSCCSLRRASRLRCRETNGWRFPGGNRRGNPYGSLPPARLVYYEQKRDWWQRSS
jgi:hypothetical protein